MNLLSTILKTHCVVLLAVATLCLQPNAVHAQKKKKRKKVSAIITHARAYVGTPYRYGGMSKKGIDCSGLMFQCFKKAGYDLPRTAKEQSKFGKKIGWGSIRPGDIVFFKFKEKGEKWWHSGVISRVKKDDIKFIHASSSRGVVESNLLSNYYKKNVKNFRRVVR